jgi:hypothetical protein
MSRPQLWDSAVQVAIKGHIVDAVANSKVTVNLLNFFSQTGTPYVPVLATLYAAIKAALVPTWKVCFCNDWICDEVQVRDLVHVTLPHFFDASPGDYTGTVAAVSGSTQESAFIQLRANATGKSYRGGLKISPIPDSKVVDNHIDPSQKTLYETMINSIGGNSPVAFSDGVKSFFLSIWSRKYSTLDPVIDNIISGSFVFSARVRKSTGTMKRRASKGVY